MKKIIMAVLISLTAAWSLGAMADTIGVVNMQKIFKTSPEARSMNASLKAQFLARKEKIVGLTKSFQTELKKYQKDQTVMSKTALASLQRNISQHGIALRQAQAKFQADLMKVQNKKMKMFLGKIKIAVEKVAKQKNLTLVFPSNAVIYSKGNLDITPAVLSKMQ